ncbi:MAG: hypothetical protein KAI89_07875 [Emcibacter sp.]|nr:hypothetical protein [Emcibacter sp.]
MTCEWEWLEDGEQKFLFVKCNETPTLEDWIKCYTEALSDYSGGPLKTLTDMRLSENTMGYNEDMAEFYNKILSMGVDKGVASLIVSDRLYHFKEKVVNAFAKFNKQPFIVKSFTDFHVAKRWLSNYKFPST